MGQETSTEGGRDPMTSAVLTCVHAGRRVPQGGIHSGKRGGAAQKKTKLQSTAGGGKAQSEQAAGEREGANGAEEGPRVAREKKTAADQVGNRHRYRGKRGRGQEEGPPTGPERNTTAKQKGAGRERPVLGARSGPRMDEDPVGPRPRVAGGPVGYKHGMMGTVDGKEKGVWLAPHNSPRRMRRRGTRGIGRDG